MLIKSRKARLAAIAALPALAMSLVMVADALAQSKGKKATGTRQIIVESKPGKKTVKPFFVAPKAERVTPPVALRIEVPKAPRVDTPVTFVKTTPAPVTVIPPVVTTVPKAAPKQVIVKTAPVHRVEPGVVVQEHPTYTPTYNQILARCQRPFH